MPQERLTVKKIKEILRLKYEAGLSNRAMPGLSKSPTAPLGNICVGQSQPGWVGRWGS
jgi:hypothetical protein